MSAPRLGYKSYAPRDRSKDRPQLWLRKRERLDMLAAEMRANARVQGRRKVAQSNPGGQATA